MRIFGSLPESDLQELRESFLRDFSELETVDFVIVGATGFLGKWISTFLTYLQQGDVAKGSLTLCARDSERLSAISKLNPAGETRIVDIESMNQGTFIHLVNSPRVVVIYAATSTSDSSAKQRLSEDAILELPRALMRLIPGTHITFVHLSSGGIYTNEARSLKAIPSGFDVKSETEDLYILQKIVLEKWTDSQSLDDSVLMRNPRLFAFYGPGLQMDRHYAIADFMNRGRRKLPIIINGNPENLRSYLYPTDALHQILSQCLLAPPIHQQIGSSVARSIISVAQVVASEYKVGVETITGVKLNTDNYVPLDVPDSTTEKFEIGVSKWRQWLDLGFS